MKRFIICFISFLLSVAPALGQNDSIDMFSLSLEDLMNIQISISTKTSSNIRETPGILTVITKEDIKASGARDIIDLFQIYVPGFSFGVDVEGVVGMGIRGLWTHEGKHLFMVDGQEFNDGMFATIPFGNHFPLENIDRIEIIRGSGSAVYGKFAGAGVVNIITRGNNSSGGQLSYLSYHTGQQFTHNNISFASNISNEDLKICLSGTYGAGTRSDRNYVDYFGEPRSMKNASDIYTKQLNLKVDYKNINFLSLVDDYTYTQIDMWDNFYPGPPLTEEFKSYFAQLSYKINFSDKFQLIPKINYKWQQPWKLSAINAENEYNNNKKYSKYSGGISSNYINKNISINGGIEISLDYLKLPSLSDTLFEETFKNGKDYLSYSNFASYGQVQYNSKYANFIVGARYDYSSEFGDAFVPRFGLTKAYEKFHFKAMISQSFRVPGGILPNRLPENSKPLEPEIGTNFEFELGFKLPYKSYITVNAFDVSFDKVIIYGKDTSGVGFYKNQGNIGTQGIELEIKQVLSKINTTVNFAYYKRKHSETDSLFSVPLNSSYFLGFSPIRINAVINYQINNNYSLGLSGSYFGKYYAYTMINSEGKDILTEKFPLIMLNINFNIRRILFNGLSASLGITNILATDFAYAQPYKGKHGLLPGQDRSFGFRITYEY